MRSVKSWIPFEFLSTSIRAPAPIIWKSSLPPLAPLPARWISAAATDSGNGSSGSVTMLRRRITTNRMPSRPPMSISRVLSQ